MNVFPTRLMGREANKGHDMVLCSVRRRSSVHLYGKIRHGYPAHDPGVQAKRLETWIKVWCGQSGSGPPGTAKQVQVFTSRL